MTVANTNKKTKQQTEDWQVGPETRAKIVTPSPAGEKKKTPRKIEVVPRMTDRKSFPKHCPKCEAGIEHLRKNGTGSNGLKLYKCKKCGKGFYKPSDVAKYKISPRQHSS